MPRKKEKRLLVNSFSGFVLYVINIVIVFVMSPFYISILGNRDYGLWELVMSVMGYMGLLDLGVGPALVRFVAVADGRQDFDELKTIISTSFAFFLVVGSLAAGAFVALGYNPCLIAGNEVKDIININTVFLLLGVNAGLLFPLQVFVATLMGIQKHHVVNYTRTLLLGVRAVLAYFLLVHYQAYGLIIMAVLEPLFTALQFAVFVIVVNRDENLPKLAVRAVSMRQAKEMIIFGAKSAVMLVASRLQNQSVPLIVGKILGLSQVVYFTIPNRLIDYAKGLALAIGFPLTPYFSAAVGRNDEKELINSWVNTTVALYIVSLAMPLVIFFCGASFLELWIGAEYAAASQNVIYILLVGLVSDSLATNSFRILTAKGQHGSCAVVWLFLSAISIPIGIIGARSIGITGAALGVTFVAVLGNFITLLFACTVMRTSLFTYLSQTLLRVAIPLLFLGIALSLCRYVLPISGYLDLVVHLIMAGSVYVVAVWLFSLDRTIRQRIIYKLRNGVLY